MRNQTYITSIGNLESVLEILKVLIREGIQQAQGYPGGPIQRRAQETEETIEEQGWLARIVHLIRGEDNDTQFKVSSINVATKPMTNINCSSCKLHENPLPMAMSVSNTPPQQSSLVHSSLRASTRNENILTIIGRHSLLLCTSSCTALSRHCTPASQARQISPFASSSHAAKWRIKMALRKSHMSILRKLSQYTKKLSAIQERSSKLFASLQVGYTRHETLARRTTIP